ncbi:MAG: hypothetical protein JW860_00190 [Sedimentisphaerales bacterium]|nr:hypothetical protein [Sedimentisphaerales bacterium]
MRKNCCVWIVVVMFCGAMVWISGCNSAIVAYEGKAASLEDVAVISTTGDSCPIITIDGKPVGLQYRTGDEYHLLPGRHTIRVVQKMKGYNNISWRIEHVDLKYDFQAGHVYTILKTNNPANLWNTDWTPTIAEQGEVVAFAAENPDYFKDSPAWKQLRKENGLTPTFFEKIGLAGWFNSESTEVAEEQPVENL